MRTELVLYLFVGAPGAGKTTVSRLIHDVTGAVHLWADHERHAMFDPVTHTKEESDQLYDALNQRAETLLAQGKSVIYDTNFNYKKDREYLRTLAAKHHAKTLIIWMQTPITIARERALQEHHRDRNGYKDTLTPQTFIRLTSHLEPPEVHENFITIDGTAIDELAVKRHLGI